MGSPDVTIAEASKAVGKSPITIRGAIREGKLESWKDGREHRVKLNDVLALFAHRSNIETRSGASSRANESSSQAIDGQAMTHLLQAQVKSLENERDFLRQLLEQEKEEKRQLAAELRCRTEELKAFIDRKKGIFRFF